MSSSSWAWDLPTCEDPKETSGLEIWRRVCTAPTSAHWAPPRGFSIRLWISPVSGREGGLPFTASLLCLLRQWHFLFLSWQINLNLQLWRIIIYQWSYFSWRKLKSLLTFPKDNSEVSWSIITVTYLLLRVSIYSLVWIYVRVIRNSFWRKY